MDDGEFLTSAHLRQRYKVTNKTLREWELRGVLPTPVRVGIGQYARKYWRLRQLEAVERERMSAKRQPETNDAA